MHRSFRDPDGYVFASGDKIFRCIFSQSSDSFLSFLDSATNRECVERGELCDSRILSPGEVAEIDRNLPPDALLVEHSRLTFPNYPYEWAPPMLHAAAALSLHLAEDAHRNGFEMKDATPFNVMFEDARPIFIDMLSFQTPAAKERVWRPYAQFVRTFLYPLLAARYFGLQLNEIFTVHREGLETARMRQLASPLRLLSQPFLELVTIPSFTPASSQAYQPRPSTDAAEAEFIQQGLLRHLRKLLNKIQPALASKHGKAAYVEHDIPYAESEFTAKQKLITDVFVRHGARSVLDIGCNTGHFSCLAARHGAKVVAIDSDQNCIANLWKTVRSSGLTVLPLVVDLARPTPSLGWHNQEGESFLDRARGRFDCVLMLGLLHHLLVTERTPLDMILNLAAELTTSLVIIEWVDPTDPQFQSIARGRQHLHTLSTAGFEAEARRHFEILSQSSVNKTRSIYVLKKRSS